MSRPNRALCTQALFSEHVPDPPDDLPRCVVATWLRSRLDEEVCPDPLIHTCIGSCIIEQYNVQSELPEAS